MVLEHSEHEEEHAHYHGVDRAEEHLSYNEAVKKLTDEVIPVQSETIPLRNATGRILAENVISRADIPHLPKSTRDGYAVNISGETVEGANLKIVGDLRIGIIPNIRVRKGEAVRIATGAFLPRGANAVLMKEYASIKNNTVVTTKPIHIRENVLLKGEDIQKGRVLLNKGARIQPHHIALLSMVGTKKIRAYRRPKVAFFSTGDELVDSESRITKDKIYDTTRPFLKSMLEQLGAEPIDLGIAKDDFKVIRSKIFRGLRFDALVLSAGSSVGERDFVSSAASSIKGVKLLAHGIAMRPSSPTGLATYKGKPFILLPGFPTSAIVSFLTLARPAIMKRSGSLEMDYPMIKARLAEGYRGKAGLTHFLRVQVKKSNGEYTAIIARPTDAQYSSWLGLANGVAIVKNESGEIRPDEPVDVFLIGSISG